MVASHFFAHIKTVRPHTAQAVAIIYKNIVAHNLVQIFCTFVRKVQVLYILFTFCRKYVLCYNKNHIMFDKKIEITPRCEGLCKGLWRCIKSLRAITRSQ